MLSGFNTNVRHRGLVFHVQTEDSGRARPHVTTLLYHQGMILSSEDQSYAEHLDDAELRSRVRGLMEKQHKRMLVQLRRGKFDALVEERLGEEAFPQPADQPAFRSADPEPAAASAPEQKPEPPAAEDRPLDEMVLEYLVEKARRRPAQ